MYDNSDEELAQAHTIGSQKITNETNDIIFTYNQRIFRTKYVRKKLKTKLICNVLPKLIGIENKGTETKQAYEYLFQIQGAHFDEIVEKFFKGKNLTSNRTFTTQLIKTVPFGKFCGTKDDFHKYLGEEIDQYQSKINT